MSNPANLYGSRFRNAADRTSGLRKHAPNKSMAAALRARQMRTVARAVSENSPQPSAPTPAHKATQTPAVQTAFGSSSRGGGRGGGNRGAAPQRAQAVQQARQPQTMQTSTTNLPGRRQRQFGGEIQRRGGIVPHTDVASRVISCHGEESYSDRSGRQRMLVGRTSTNPSYNISGNHGGSYGKTSTYGDSGGSQCSSGSCEPTQTIVNKICKMLFVSPQYQMACAPCTGTSLCSCCALCGGCAAECACDTVANTSTTAESQGAAVTQQQVATVLQSMMPLPLTTQQITNTIMSLGGPEAFRGPTGENGEQGEPGPSGFQTSFCVVRDEKTLGTNGGDSFANTWTIRDLNTLSGQNDVGVSVANDQITLQPGLYLLMGEAPAYGVRAHRLRLQRINDNQTVMTGSSVIADANTMAMATLNGLLNVTEAATFELQHHTELSQAGTGFGVAAGFGVPNEVYASIVIGKLGDAVSTDVFEPIN